MPLLCFLALTALRVRLQEEKQIFVLVVLVSCGCCNKAPQTAGLKTIGIYFPTVLRARSLK